MDKNLTIIVGHYGSGKTEFAVNYAVKSKSDYEKVNLIDLDIINPYFRSRERKKELQELNIKVIESSIQNKNLDLPSLSPGINGAINESKSKTIIDAGGDPIGAKALSRYYNQIRKKDYDMFLVVNANRAETQTVEKVIEYCNKIQGASRLIVTGLINNTHLLKATTTEDVYKGKKLVEEVSEKLNIPIKYHSAMRKIADEINNKTNELKIFPLHLYMRENWMY
ncbi:MAG: ATP-binding protein [Bacillota bacterium]|nr:ATP-binding protein [Bacillota bacterium]